MRELTSAELIQARIFASQMLIQYTLAMVLLKCEQPENEAEMLSEAVMKSIDRYSVLRSDEELAASIREVMREDVSKMISNALQAVRQGRCG